jgi:hypothetical protein
LDSDQDVTEQSSENVWSSFTGGLKCEAHDVVSLKERLRVVNVACQIVDINTGECVWLAGVSTKSKQFGIGDFYGNGFGSEGQD